MARGDAVMRVGWQKTSETAQTPLAESHHLQPIKTGNSAANALATIPRFRPQA